jgi:hypothetical protein
MSREDDERYLRRTAQVEQTEDVAGLMSAEKLARDNEWAAQIAARMTAEHAS